MAAKKQDPVETIAVPIEQPEITELISDVNDSEPQKDDDSEAVDSIEQADSKLNADGFVGGELVTTEQLYEYERKKRSEANAEQTPETTEADAS